MALFLGDKLIGTNSIGTRIEEKDVNFYDYDNTLLYSFTAEEANALTVLPQLPDRTNINLTNEGWNWSLADIKKQLEEVGGIVDVGCTYYTTDGKTHIIFDTHPTAYTLRLRITPSAANDVTVDWGDGTTDTIENAKATTLTHDYSNITSEKRFDVSISSDNNYTFPTYLSETETYNKYSQCIRSIFCSKKLTTLGQYCLAYLHGLEVVTFHNTISFNNSFMFYNDYLLKCVIVPNNSTTIGTRFSYSRTHIILPSTITTTSNNVRYVAGVILNTLPFGLTTIGSDFMRANYNLKTVYLGKNISSFNTQVFYDTNYKVIQINRTTPPTLASSTSIYNAIEIRVPASAVNTYKNDSNWANYASRIVAIQ